MSSVELTNNKSYCFVVAHWLNCGLSHWKSPLPNNFACWKSWPSPMRTCALFSTVGRAWTRMWVWSLVVGKYLLVVQKSRSCSSQRPNLAPFRNNNNNCEWQCIGVYVYVCVCARAVDKKLINSRMQITVWPAVT